MASDQPSSNMQSFNTNMDMPFGLSTSDPMIRVDYEHAPVHHASSGSELTLSTQHYSAEEESDNETTACISTSSEGTIIVPMNLEHHQREYIKNTSESESFPVAQLHSISLKHINSISPPMSYTLDSKSDTNSVFLDICKICHQPSDPEDPLISPCRCAGSLQYIHGACLTVSIPCVCVCIYICICAALVIFWSPGASHSSQTRTLNFM